MTTEILHNQSLEMQTGFKKLNLAEVEIRKHSLRVTDYYRSKAPLSFKRYRMPELPDVKPEPSLLENLKERGRQHVVQSIAAVLPLI